MATIMKVEIDANHLVIVAVVWWLDWMAAYRALSVAKNTMNGNLSASAPGQAVISLASEEGANVEKTRHQYNI
eukprot:scaffold131_cov164-Skeletonema_marinoi.AAC.3